jgi:hypothetical protein
VVLNAGLFDVIYIFTFVTMAYNRQNYVKRAKYIISVYNQYKQSDVPDTRILNNYFPKHNIFISYRQWMNIKGMVFPKEENHQQLSLF